MNNDVRTTVIFLMVTLLTIGLPLVVQADEYSYTIGQSIEFSSGKYDTDTRTNTIYAPFTILAFPTDRLFLSLEVPFIYQNNGNFFSNIARGTSQVNTTTDSLTSSEGENTSSPTNQSKSGLGDILFRAGYTIALDNDSLPNIRPTVFVKFPTADKDKSLGTGEFDGGFAVEVSRWLGKWYPSAEAGYTVQGRSSQFSLRNYMTYNAGVGYQINDRFYPSLVINGTTPPANGVSSLLEVRLKLRYLVSKHTSIDGFVSRGITSFTPEYGTGLAVYYNF